MVLPRLLVNIWYDLTDLELRNLKWRLLDTGLEDEEEEDDE